MCDPCVAKFSDFKFFASILLSNFVRGLKSRIYIINAYAPYNNCRYF